MVVKAGRAELAGGYRQLKGLTVQQLQPLLAILVTTAAAEAAVPVTSKGQMRQHCLDGHRPYKNDCPWCVRANIGERRAFRKYRHAHTDAAGWLVHSDFTGPHEADTDGNVQACVGVEGSTGYGFVGLQEDRSAKSTLELVKQLESELKQVSGDADGRVVHHHHGKSFEGGR